MRIGDLVISEEEFIEYLDESINDETVDKALRAAGLLPFESTITVKPKIISSKKDFFTKDVYEMVDQIIFNESSSRNYVTHVFTTTEIKSSLVDARDNKKIAFAA